MMDVNMGTVMPCGGGCGESFRDGRTLSVTAMHLESIDCGWGLLDLPGLGAVMACKKCKTHEVSESFVESMRKKVEKENDTSDLPDIR